MMKKSLIFILIGSFALAGMCPSALAAPAAVADISAVKERDSADEGPGAYIIGPQNLLQVRIFGEASINQLYRVDEDGYVRHALAGRVKLGGMTVAEAEKIMEQKLDGDYIINPQVSIFVLEYSHFSIIGEVRRPGSYEISGRVSVIRAISIAGGFTPIANQRGVQINRKNPDGTEAKINVDATRIMQGDLDAEQDLQADDVIVVPKSFF